MAHPTLPALARIDDAMRLAALRLPRIGKNYDLGVELNPDSPSVPGFARFTFAFTHTPEMTASRGFSFAGETVAGAVHAGTHIDALVHVQANGRIFGGAKAREARTDRGWLAACRT